MYDYKAKITNIVDGDTFDVDIDLGFHTHIHERIRILDVDTPEKRGVAEKTLGLIMTEFAKKHFLNCSIVLFSKKEILPKTDSFGRWLVDIRFEDGEYAGNMLSELYTMLGVNKYAENYSEENVMELYNKELEKANVGV